MMTPPPQETTADDNTADLPLWPFAMHLSQVQAWRRAERTFLKSERGKEARQWAMKVAWLRQGVWPDSRSDRAVGDSLSSDQWSPR